MGQELIMAESILLDTDVLIDFFRGHSKAVAFVNTHSVVPVDVDIAKAGGLYKHSFGKSHGVGLADAIIAAIAEVENAELKTLNTRHYPMLKGLTPAYKK
jgi:predicted nucleic acid-binding protein